MDVAGERAGIVYMVIESEIHLAHNDSAATVRWEEMKMKRRKLTISISACVVTVFGLLMGFPSGEAQGGKAAGGENQARAVQPAQGEYKLKIPFGLEDSAVVIPADNPLTNDKVELGRLLFFDKRLSKNSTIACASCHMAQFAFTDGRKVSTGIHGLKGDRSAPASFNRVFSTVQFWDGRAATLEEQSIGPFTNPVEHGFANYDEMIAKMKKIAGYRKLFRQVFGTEVTIDGVGKAIASFQRTILSGNSPADRFDQGQEEKAISAAAQNGLVLFREKARCARCHSGFNITDEKFHNLGIGWDDNKVDLGRYMVTKNPEEIGAFKTPTLREIARSAPYMHDGRFKTLEEVVNFYNKGGVKNPHQDNLIIPLELTEQEKHDLVEFLRTLSGEGWQHVKVPTSFPK